MTDARKKWIKENPEKILEIKRRYYLKHRLRILESKAQYCREYARKNREKYYAQTKRWKDRNRELIRAKNREYMSRNKDKCRAWDAKKRIVRLASLSVAVVEDCSKRISLLKWREKFCHWCCTRLTTENFSIDHVIPIARCGSHIPGNLVAACITCNKSKSDKLVSEWSWELAA